MANRDQRAGFFSCLSQQQGLRQPGHDPVAGGETEGKRRGARRKLGHHSASGCRDLIRKLCVFLRINIIEAAAKHRDGFSARLQGPLVGGGIDAPRKA